VATIRVQTILVVAALLVLLLQLPRLDDPPELRVVGSEITRTEDMGGAALYVDTGAGGIVLVFVSELRMHRDPAGAAYVTKVDGVVLDGGSGSKRLHIDVTQEALALGWQPVMRFDGLVFPGNSRDCHAHELRRLRFRKVIHKGRDVLLVVGRVEGVDLVTGQVISEDFDEHAACPAIPLLEPVSVSSSPGGFDVESSRRIGGSRSTGNGEPFWALTGTVCWQSGRKAAWHSLPGWTAGHRCS